MASVTLAVSGAALTAIGQPIGIGLLAASVGASFLDQKYILPALFGDDSPENDLPLPTLSAEDGVSAPLPIGEEVRVPGYYMWIGPYTPVNKNLGPNTKIPTWEVDCVVGFARYEADASPGINTLLKVYGEGEEIWVADALKAITFTDTFSVVRPKFIAGVTNGVTHKVDSAQGGPDLTEFHENIPITYSGWNKTINNSGGSEGIAYVVTRVERLSNGGTRMHSYWTRTFKSLFGDPRETNTANVTLSQTAPNIRKNRIASLDFRKGFLTDAIYPEIQTIEDPGEPIPAFRRTASTLLRKLNLYDFGNRPPRPECLVNGTGANTTTGQAIDYILRQRTKLPTDKWDVSQIQTDIVTGYAILGVEAPSKSIEPILVDYDILIQERRDVMHFFNREDAERITIPIEDFGCHDIGEEAPDQPFSIETIPVESLPSELEYTYIDKDDEHQEHSIPVRVIFPAFIEGGTTVASPNPNKKMTYRSPIAQTADEAEARARRLLWSAWANRYIIKGTLPGFRYDYLRTNDVITPSEPVDGQTWDIILTQLDMGANGVMRFEGLAEYSEVLIQKAGTGFGRKSLKSKPTVSESQTATVSSPKIGRI